MHRRMKLPDIGKADTKWLIFFRETGLLGILCAKLYFRGVDIEGVVMFSTPLFSYECSVSMDI